VGLVPVQQAKRSAMVLVWIPKLTTRTVVNVARHVQVYNVVSQVSANVRRARVCVVEAVSTCSSMAKTVVSVVPHVWEGKVVRLEPAPVPLDRPIVLEPVSIPNLMAKTVANVVRLAREAKLV
jgi:hypothetical protein